MNAAVRVHSGCTIAYWCNEKLMDLTNRCSIPGSGNDFSLLQSFQTGSGVHPTRYQCVPNILSRQRLEVHHSRLTNVDVKNEWRCTSSCLICLHTLHTDSFIITSYKHISFRIKSLTAIPWRQRWYSVYCGF